MKFRKYYSYVTVLGMLLSLNLACTNANQNRRFGLNGVAGGTVPVPGTIFARGGIPNCNTGDMNPSSMTSVCNVQSTCYLPNYAPQCQQASGQTTAYQNNNVVPNPANGQVNSTMPQLSIDIPTTGVGRIVSKHFTLAGGAAVENVNDNCHLLSPDTYDTDGDDSSDTDTSTQRNDPNKNHVSIARFLSPAYGDRLDFKFDENGNLMIFAQSIDGQVSTSQSIPPGQYQLDSSSQTIHVNSFTMAGPVSPQFAQQERSLNRMLQNLENKNIKDELNIDGSVPEGFDESNNNGPSSMNGGSHGFITGTSANGSGTASTNGTYTSAPLSTQQEIPSVVTLAVPEFTAYIATHPLQPQNVVGLYIKTLPFNSETFVNDRVSGDYQGGCKGNGQGQYVHLLLKPAM